MPGPNKVLTPFGERPAENVRLVPAGGRVINVQNQIQLADAAGNKRRVGGSRADSSIVPTDNWATYAYWRDNTHFPIASFTAAWRVPDLPDVDKEQTLFLLNSLETQSNISKSERAILQPVLQYGPSAAGGGPYWSVASWYLTGDNVFYTPLVQVSRGDPLVGTITLRAKIEEGSHIVWCYTSSFSTIEHTTLDVYHDKEPLVWASVSLAAYNAPDPFNYPDSSTLFYPTTIRTTPQSPHFDSTEVVHWTPVTNFAGKVATKVNVDGATDAKISILYPNDLSA